MFEHNQFENVYFLWELPDGSAPQDQVQDGEAEGGEDGRERALDHHEEGDGLLLSEQVARPEGEPEGNQVGVVAVLQPMGNTLPIDRVQLG